MDGDLELLRRIERYGWMMTGLLTVGALIARYPLVASGCALGGALSVLHFKWLAMFLAAVVELGFLGGLSVIFVAICLAGLQRAKPLGEPQK